MQPILVGPRATIESRRGRRRRQARRRRTGRGRDAASRPRPPRCGCAGKAAPSALMKGSLHTDELMARRRGARGRAAHRAPHQPCLRDGRAVLPQGAVHHRRRDQHRARPDDQGGHHPERDGHAARARQRAAEGRDPLGGRDGEPEDPGHARCRGALQDGRPRADHRRGCWTGRWPSTTRSAALRRPIKKIVSPVAGDADILVVPDLEAGNMLAKQLSYLAGADSAGIVLGARVPIILTSRADSVASRLASVALARLLRGRRAGRRRGMSDAARRRRRRQRRLLLAEVLAVRRATDCLPRTARWTASASGRASRRRMRPGAALPAPGPSRRPPRAPARRAARAAALAAATGSAAAAGRASGTASCMAGRRYAAPERVTPALLEELEGSSPLAPLHQPHNLAPIRAALDAMRRTCRRSPASTPPSTAPSRRWPGLRAARRA